MVNIDNINGYLKAMACLNAGPNHFCNFTVKLFDHMTILRIHWPITFNQLPMGTENFDAQLWHIKPKQITVDEFIQQIDTWFFQQYYSPTVHKKN